MENSKQESVNPRVYIGWDAREEVAYNVCEHSILKRNRRVEIIPLKHRELRKKGKFFRPWLTEATTGDKIDLIDGKPFSTEFSHTRFLVPSLAGFDGWAIFMDCDMIVRCDINEILKYADPKYACMVVKHNHKPKERTKMDDQQQAMYFRKNWSSFILWNCGHYKNRQLTPEFVSCKPGSFLHGFEWLNEHEIGILPWEYNWIEGSSPSNIEPKIIHYTLGGPWFPNHQDVTHADLWTEEYEYWQRDGEHHLKFSKTPTRTKD